MKKVGILGGTFDPPHLGHLIIANEVLHHLALDEIHFMPNQEPPHKNRVSGTTAEDRVRMLELSISGNSQFLVEKIELERNGRSYTIDTMKILQETNPDYDYYFIIGADMVEYLPNWHKVDELVKLIQFVGVNRPGYKLETNYPITQMEVPQIDISSTLLREKLQQGISTKYLLPDKVISYIKEQHLYGY
ncbi:nicotinate-nucleotide adenylyltransferase [Lederbergia lenta]|uniref:Probable nicotinate-nucleotide adenylyltransferase n=1 Tax=Lederbergia lenta TaxID=1467 RepID=A0A2X4VYL5_LEDLE|nr:nicotinate-nucleotide adenylyltransferase [Lederbergia lenta]MCM3111348.1 nicotinate-nucleotide adenylyltransferase [Lederbergia lenta]MEC2325265.1 nicotinate-nucleotide adenylyltransferase [Lederbergia lenta]SQI55873.1 nicotinate (nicotinamide) nucleotide adenylyltransferase [Lederbergia lenta]